MARRKRSEKSMQINYAKNLNPKCEVCFEPIQDKLIRKVGKSVCWKCADAINIKHKTSPEQLDEYWRQLRLSKGLDPEPLKN